MSLKRSCAEISKSNSGKRRAGNWSKPGFRVFVQALELWIHQPNVRRPPTPVVFHSLRKSAVAVIGRHDLDDNEGGCGSVTALRELDLDRPPNRRPEICAVRSAPGVPGATTRRVRGSITAPTKNEQCLDLGMKYRWQGSFHHLPVHVIRFGAVVERQVKVFFHADLRSCQHCVYHTRSSRVRWAGQNVVS